MWLGKKSLYGITLSLLFFSFPFSYLWPTPTFGFEFLLEVYLFIGKTSIQQVSLIKFNLFMVSLSEFFFFFPIFLFSFWLPTFGFEILLKVYLFMGKIL